MVVICLLLPFFVIFDLVTGYQTSAQKKWNEFKSGHK